MNTKLKEAMKYMDQKYIDEAVEYKAKTRTHKPLVRWGAIAACLVLMVSLSVGYFGGHFTQPQEEIILPPVRYNENMYATLVGFSMEEAFESADIVAWVRVGNWLSEDFENIGRTFFEAEIIQCFKGEITGEFVLCQYGSSKGTFKGYPLFTHGNELLLFLSEMPSHLNTEAYEITYQSIGMCETLMDIVKDEDGTVYVSTRMNHFGESIAALKQGPKNLADNSQLKETLGIRAMAVDEIQHEEVTNAEYLFELEALKECFE